MPGALNVPAGSLIDPLTRRMLGTRELSARFASLPIPENAQIVTTCGSGVTACVVALALFEIGYNNISVYDGSWNEWARQALDLATIR
jgi:thiosulfate/3-mercaptopyruvate sulfurtransferase